MDIGIEVFLYWNSCTKATLKCKKGYFLFSYITTIRIFLKLDHSKKTQLREKVLSNKFVQVMVMPPFLQSESVYLNI